MILPRLDVHAKDGAGRWFVLGLGANAMDQSEK